jgi:hypothetical protein
MDSLQRIKHNNGMSVNVVGGGMLMKYNLVVVGAGAAGLMAAWRAADAGARVLLLEKNNLPGRKLLLSGAGRCNLTNAAPLDEFILSYFENGRFLYPAFQRFFRPELLALLHRQGLTVREEAGGKLFPVSNKAADVLDALLLACRSAGVTFQYSEPVRTLVTLPAEDSIEQVISKRSPNYKARICTVQTSQGEYPANAVILACGGSSWPGTGSSGDGYQLASSAGHTLIMPRPALVPFNCRERWISNLSGISCPDIDVQLLKNGRAQAKTRGDLLWTHTGVSGPAILRLSRAYTPGQNTADSWQLLVCLCPDCNAADLTGWLKGCCRRRPRAALYNAVSAESVCSTGQRLPRALASALLRLAGSDPEQKAADTSLSQIEVLAQLLQQLPLTVSGTRGFREAMVTAGGINLREIDPRTLMSRLVYGLYAAGEVLDIDGDTGGFNLQAAFSTGFLAGESAAAQVVAEG